MVAFSPPKQKKITENNSFMGIYWILFQITTAFPQNTNKQKKIDRNQQKIGFPSIEV